MLIQQTEHSFSPLILLNFYGRLHGVDQYFKMSEKPSIETLLAYAEKSVKYHLMKLAIDWPVEQREEMQQNAMLRIIEAYPKIKAVHWKSFVQLHCRGAVLDYKRDGKGFEESDWGLIEKAAAGGAHAFRAEVFNEDNESQDVETIAGLNGVNSETGMPEESVFHPRWDLIARMASKDPLIHLIAKRLLGFTQEELAAPFGVSRERIAQRTAIFWEKLDDPRFYDLNWVKQTIFAFGLSEFYQMEDKDLGVGWGYEPIDLYSDLSKDVIDSPEVEQMALPF